jgi:protease IV
MKPALAIFFLALLGLAGCEGRHRFSPAAPDSRSEPRSGPYIAILDLSEGVPEQGSGGLLGLSPKVASLEDLVDQIDGLGRESDVRGVLVRLGTAHVGLGRASEVGELLATLKTRWPVWCHADEYNNGTLYVAARGCTRIWASAAGTVEAIGLASQTLYFHRLLAEQLGLDVDFLQVGKFKGAEEPFTRDGPSPEARQSLESTLADLRLRWLEGIRSGRSNAQDTAAEDGPYSAQQARERGLVDDVGYLDEARAALQKDTGAVRAEVRLGPGAASSADSDFVEALRALAGESFASTPVVLVRATGAISMDGGGILSDGSGIVERKLVRTLARLEKDDDVKAVVLRIDSPGGSALASDLLWHQLMRIRAAKTLVVSVGDMAASGGYYLASAGAVVFAEETSIVGSIGVVGGKIAVDRALEKIGIHAETFSAKTRDRRAEARAAYDSLLMPWDDATRERVLQTMTGVYRLFLARVSEGRGISVERVAQFAEGRIFSGHDGRARGLVDVIGGLREAIARARVLGGLPPDARVGLAGEPNGIFQALAAEQGRGDTRAARFLSEETSGMREVLPFVASIAPLAKGEEALCALPFALTVR